VSTQAGLVRLSVRDDSLGFGLASTDENQWVLLTSVIVASLGYHLFMAMSRFRYWFGFVSSFPYDNKHLWFGFLLFITNNWKVFG
jgi:hypothetical protein